MCIRDSRHGMAIGPPAHHHFHASRTRTFARFISREAPMWSRQSSDRVHHPGTPPVTTLQDQLQRTLGETYTIDREIGRGGMATVFLARDEKHHRSVALKVLDPELGAVLGAERFLSEIRVTAALQHPNLLPLFDSGEAGGLLYYVCLLYTSPSPRDS